MIQKVFGISWMQSMIVIPGNHYWQFYWKRLGVMICRKKCYITSCTSQEVNRIFCFYLSWFLKNYKKIWKHCRSYTVFFIYMFAHMIATSWYQDVVKGCFSFIIYVKEVLKMKSDRRHVFERILLICGRVLIS